MSAEKKVVGSVDSQEMRELEVRKVKALEKIGRNLEALSIWFDDVDKDDWSSRIQWYLDMFKKAYLDPKLGTDK
jgi:hypothetical protein